MPQKRKKTKAILDKTRKNIFVVGQFLEWCHVGGQSGRKILECPMCKFFSIWMAYYAHTLNAKILSCVNLLLLKHKWP